MGNRTALHLPHKSCADVYVYTRIQPRLLSKLMIADWRSKIANVWVMVDQMNAGAAEQIDIDTVIPII